MCSRGSQEVSVVVRIVPRGFEELPGGLRGSTNPLEPPESWRLKWSSCTALRLNYASSSNINVSFFTVFFQYCWGKVSAHGRLRYDRIRMFSGYTCVP